jgi:Ca-activated chloride channel family protein
MPGVTSHRRGIDARSYVDDYESTAEGAAPSSGRTFSSDASAGPIPPEPRAPTVYDDNTFTDDGRNPFVTTAADPTSTFGLDVDSGSPTVARVFLERGSLPPPASVRTEEWVNAMGSTQPAATDGALSITADTAPTADGTTLVRVGVASRTVTEQERPNVNLTFVVDTSGSMDIRERLGLVRSSLALLADHLRDDDTIAIVEYADEAGVVLEPTPVRDTQRILAAIDRLQPSSSTNLEAGLRTGYDLAARSFDPDEHNAVLLASDGVANVGETGPGSLAAEIQDRAQQGIHLVTVGYGMGNYNDTLMEQLADRGDGFYRYVDSFEEAQGLFRDRLSGLLSVVADDAKAQITFDPTTVTRYRQIGYENRQLTDESFEDPAADAGEVGAGHRVTALYEVEVAHGVGTGAGLGTATLRYRDAESGDATERRASIAVAAASTPDAAPADLRLQAAAARFADWLADPQRTRAQRDAIEADLQVVPDQTLAGATLTRRQLLDLVRLAATARTEGSTGGQDGQDG